VTAATGGLFALALFAGVATLYLHRASDVVDGVAGGPVARLLGFFGIGELPVLLAVGLFASTAGASGLAHVAIARASLNGARPMWLPALATGSAAGLGLIALRIAAAARARREKSTLLQKSA